MQTRMSPAREAEVTDGVAPTLPVVSRLDFRAICTISHEPALPEHDHATADLIQFLKFASVSTDPAHKATRRLRRLARHQAAAASALTAEKHETPGHPVVVARNAAPAPAGPTVLIYGHYDVQPADPLDLWKTPPFEPRIEDGVDLRARLDRQQGPDSRAHHRRAGGHRSEDGDLPVNLIFLIEGEEEIGSPNLGRVPGSAPRRAEVRHRGRFRQRHGRQGQADVYLRPARPRGDGTARHRPVARTCTAASSAARSPIPPRRWRGCSPRCTTRTGKVAVEGFYDDVRPLADWEREAWSKLPMQDDETPRTDRLARVVRRKGLSARSSAATRGRRRRSTASAAATRARGARRSSRPRRWRN